MKKLPQEQEKQEQDAVMNYMKPYKVNLVALGSLVRDHEGYLYLLHNGIVSDYRNDVNTTSENINLQTFNGNSGHIHLPIVNFDGTLVMLLDNITPYHRKVLQCGEFNPVVNQGVINESHPIEFYSVDDPDLLEELTIEGMHQLMKFYAATEQYNCAAIVRKRIEDDEFLEKLDPELDNINMPYETANELAQKIGLKIVEP